MNRENPFFFSDDPYDNNPFRLLNVEPDDALATIEAAARTREHLLERGIEPADGLTVSAGEFNRAASELRDPIKRLAFDLFAHCAGTEL